jgi:hypothetical protein
VADGVTTKNEEGIRMSDRIQYLLALLVGLLAIPGLAFATTSALSNDEPEETSEVLGIVATATTADPSAISAEDLVRACGVEGHYLTELEAVAGIDDIQQAALNALRPICDEAGLPLPAAPIVDGETIVETVTVVRTVPGSPAAATDSTTTTSLGNEENGNDSEALSARERGLDAINQAIEVGGSVEKINAAIALVERGDAAREAGDFDRAADLYEAAEDNALEAQQELEQRHEDEDDDHEDDDHEDDDHEDDDHEDDD